MRRFDAVLQTPMVPHGVVQEPPHRIGETSGLRLAPCYLLGSQRDCGDFYVEKGGATGLAGQNPLQKARAPRLLSGFLLLELLWA